MVLLCICPPALAGLGRVPPEIPHPRWRDRAVRRYLREQDGDRSGGWNNVRRRSGPADPAIAARHVPRIDGRNVDRATRSWWPSAAVPSASSIRPNACQSSAVPTSPPLPSGNAGRVLHCPSGPSASSSPPAGLVRLLLKAAGADRHRPGPRSLPGHDERRDVRRPPGRSGGRRAGGVTRRVRGAAAVLPAERARSSPGWPGRPLHRGALGWRADSAPGAERIRPRHVRGG